MDNATDGANGLPVSAAVGHNTAQGGGANRNGTQAPADGGGLFIQPAAAVNLDAFTLNHTTGNKPDNLDGSYTLIT